MGHRILVGDVRERLRQLDPESVHCCITSPPYLGLRSYGTHPQVWGGDESHPHEWGDEIRRTGGSGLQGETGDRADRSNTAAQRLQRRLGAFCACGAWMGEHGSEPSLALWLAHQVLIWREIRRVLRKDGVAFLNIGDAYANDGKWGGETGGKQHYLNHENRARTGREKRRTGLPAKSRMLLPERLITALQDDLWVIRDTIVWAKSNPMPSSVTDRTTPAHEMLYVLARRSWYYWDALAIAEPATYDGPNSPGSIRSPYGQGFSRANLPEPSGWDRESARHDQWQYRGRAAGNKRHKYTEEFAKSTDVGNRTKANLLDVAHTARNKRSVWSIATEPFPEAHFATFPTGLVEPCILAGTSHRGACSDCGAPWQRIERVTYSNPGNRSTNGPRSMERKHIEGGSAYEVRLALTLGWFPGCRCYGLDALPKCPRVKRVKGETPGRWQKRRERELKKWEKIVRPRIAGAVGLATVPCTVLDPFFGSGTTGLVADRLGRSSIGIELNADFATMAQRRMASESSLFAPMVECADE